MNAYTDRQGLVSEYHSLRHQILCTEDQVDRENTQHIFIITHNFMRTLNKNTQIFILSENIQDSLDYNLKIFCQLYLFIHMRFGGCFIPNIFTSKFQGMKTDFSG